MPSRNALIVRTTLALSAVAAAGAAVALSTGAEAATPAAAPAPATASAHAPSGANPGTTPATPAPTPSATHTDPAPTATPHDTTPPRTGNRPSPAAEPRTTGPTRHAAAPKPPEPLPAKSLPDSEAARWKPMGPTNTRPVGPETRLNECATVRGAASWQQQGYVSAFKTPAIEDSFTFATEAAATGAYQNLVTDLAGCQDTSREVQREAGLTVDARVERTAATADGNAYRREWTGVAGMSAPGAQTNHVYLVRRGATVTVLQFTEMRTASGPRHSYDIRDDRATLATLAR
ncbi:MULTISPECIES: hypothetical protein [Streptomyces]|uniref:hypothetical protein n=1 Tax=Streptomyces TaxID=1883 RepID=UPI00167A1934|nr:MULTISPECIES: hypothetical protein [Streptomyces]MBK3523510.1 hypothetical protein [Streptomyces sp. MBT70]GGS02193.1 hypothetical protein GCM10010236_66010 [Streptomyces eurythermus]